MEVAECSPQQWVFGKTSKKGLESYCEDHERRKTAQCPAKVIGPILPVTFGKALQEVSRPPGETEQIVEIVSSNDSCGGVVEEEVEEKVDVAVTLYGQLQLQRGCEQVRAALRGRRHHTVPTPFQPGHQKLGKQERVIAEVYR